MLDRLKQVAIRLVEQPPLYSETPMDGPEAAVRVMHDLLADMDREVFCIVNLQSDLRPINMNIVSVGALDHTIAHPREIFKSAILSNASRMLLIHNHPSGVLTPSNEDIQTTARIQEAGELMGIPLVDHIIVAKGQEYYSFKEKGVLPVPRPRTVRKLDDLYFAQAKQQAMEEDWDQGLSLFEDIGRTLEAAKENNRYVKDSLKQLGIRQEGKPKEVPGVRPEQKRKENKTEKAIGR